MGDGNHSLATAKAIWQKKKTTLTSEQQKEDPARFALVELVNVYDEWLVFEPIHRVLFWVDPADVEAELQKSGLHRQDTKELQTFLDEYIEMLQKYEVDFNKDYLFDELIWRIFFNL